MKALILLFLFYIPSFAFSQDCQAVNQITEFHGLKFGQRVPDSVIRFCIKKGLKDREMMFLNIDSLNQATDYNYIKLFRFTEKYTEFSDIAITITTDKKLQSIYLWNAMDSFDSSEIAAGNYPTKFSNLKNRISSLFGNNFKKVDATDPVLKQVLGIQEKYIWQCSNVRLTLEISYGGSQNFSRTISVEIVDVKTEKAEKLKNITN